MKSLSDFGPEVVFRPDDTRDLRLQIQGMEYANRLLEDVIQQQRLQLALANHRSHRGIVYEVV